MRNNRQATTDTPKPCAIDLHTAHSKGIITSSAAHDTRKRGGADMTGDLMQKFLILGALVTLTACGGARVSGEVGKACMAADRKSASVRLCSCVQQAANHTLSSSEQRRAATFFENPQLAQDIRQSDNRSSERFWKRYKNFSSIAKRMCG